MAFMDRWPTGKTDDLNRAFAAWRGISDDDRKMALEGIDAFRIANRADGRSVICASSTYLKNRSWERLAPSARGSTASGSATTLGAFSRPWWLVFHRRRARGEPLRLMLSQASEGRGYSVGRSDLPTEADELAMAKLDRTSAEFGAWRANLAADGLHLPDITVPFVWMPSPWPAGSEPIDIDEDGFDGSWRRAI